MPPIGEQVEVERFRIEIDGETFHLRGVATQEHMEELAEIVNAKIDEVRRAHPNLPRHRIAILVALNLADELVSLRKENEELFELLEETR